MKKLYIFFSIVTLTLTSTLSKAQNVLFVDSGYTAQQMVTDFFGNSSCVSISNITYTGPNISMGFFDGSQSNIGLNAGLIVTSGSIFNAPGPNSSASMTQANGAPGDSDLDALTTGTTQDASVIEFDFVPSNDTLCFHYVFASEEFNDFVGSGFNDVFGFFITGPGYIGAQNIALIPNTTSSVAINNVNCGINGAYYVCNDPWDPFGGGCTVECPTSSGSTTVEYDGFTTPLCAKLICVPDSTYHIKIGVSDVGDQSFDSGVFLSIESLCGGAGLACVANFLPGFGTDSNDVSFDNNSVYGSSWFWDFGDGTTSSDQHPNHTYAANGTYVVTLITCNFSGCDTTYQTITIGTTSINTTTLSDVMVYPNPANNELRIRSISGGKGIVKIYDAAGRLMTEQTLDQNALVDVSSWANGIYTVELTAENNVSRTRFYKK